MNQAQKIAIRLRFLNWSVYEYRLVLQHIINHSDNETVEGINIYRLAAMVTVLLNQ